MKKNIVTILALFILSGITAQKVEVPEVIAKALEQRFGGVEKAEWSKSNQGWYIANFNFEGKHNYLNFYENGTILEHGIEVSYNDLNDVVKSSFTKKYGKNKVVAVYRLFSAVAPERNRIDIESNGAKKSLYYSLKGNLYLEK